MKEVEEKLTIRLSNEPPVRVLEREWPLVARSEAHLSWLEMRRHEDGRVIIYGGAEMMTRHAGRILTPKDDAELCDRVYAVCHELFATAWAKQDTRPHPTEKAVDLARQLIQAMPAREL